MANFDPNQWYQLTVKSGNGVSMFGSSLYDHGLGTIFFQKTNTALPTERWQLFPYNSSTYAIRSQDSGHNGYLATDYSVNETTPGQTRPRMSNYTLADDSMFWKISPWGDGTFYLTNLANGTAWHLQVKPNTLMAMSSNFTAPQDGGAFSFTALGAIDNSAYSTINPPSGPSTATSTEATTSASNPPSTSSPTSTASTNSTGLSVGALAAIGLCVGIAVLLLVIAGYYFWRRQRKRKQFAHSYKEGVAVPVGVEPNIDLPKELPYSLPPAEMMAGVDSSAYVELHGQSRSELPGEMRGNAI